MDLVSRAKNICLSPASEWRVIDSEPASTGELMTGYALPLAAIGAIASLIGSLVFASMFGAFAYVRSIPVAIVTAVVGLVMALVGTFIFGLIIDALAPTFGGQKDPIKALKLAVYSQTPGWVAGILYVIPFLGVLGILAALYGIYLLYVGLPILMRSPQEKAVPYTLVIIVCAIGVMIVLGMISALIGGAAYLGSRIM
jgi:hypothetical protein